MKSPALSWELLYTGLFRGQTSNFSLASGTIGGFVPQVLSSDRRITPSGSALNLVSRLWQVSAVVLGRVWRVGFRAGRRGVRARSRLDVCRTTLIVDKLELAWSPAFQHCVINRPANGLIFNNPPKVPFGIIANSTFPSATDSA